MSEVWNLPPWFWLNVMRSIGFVVTMLAIYRSFRYRRHWSLTLALLLYGFYLLIAISDHFYRQIPLTGPIAVAHLAWWMIAGRLALPRRKKVQHYHPRSAQSDSATVATRRR